MKNKNTMMAVAVVLIIVAAAGGFYAGMHYRTGKVSKFSFGQGKNVRQRFARNGNNFRPVRGKIITVGNNSFTVKLPNGSSEIVVLSNATTFLRSANASRSDLKTGDTVNVLGTANSDGSVTAQDVQINPLGIRRPAAGSSSASR